MRCPPQASNDTAGQAEANAKKFEVPSEMNRMIGGVVYLHS